MKRGLSFWNHNYCLEDGAQRHDVKWPRNSYKQGSLIKQQFTHNWKNVSTDYIVTEHKSLRDWIVHLTNSEKFREM